MKDNSIWGYIRVPPILGTAHMFAYSDTRECSQQLATSSNARGMPMVSLKLERQMTWARGRAASPDCCKLKLALRCMSVRRSCCVPCGQIGPCLPRWTLIDYSLQAGCVPDLPNATDLAHL